MSFKKASSKDWWAIWWLWFKIFS